MTPCSCGPPPRSGAFGRRVIEADFVQGFIVGGATGIVRAGTLVRARDPDRLPARLRAAAAVRRRRPAPLLPDRELVTIHLSIILFLPLARRPRRAPLLPRGMARWAALAGTVAVLAYAIVMLADFDSGARGLQYVTDDEWIPELGIRYQLGVDGLNLFMVVLTAIAWVPCTLVAAFREHERPSASSSSTWRSPRPPCWAPSWPRTWRSSSSSST